METLLTLLQTNLLEPDLLAFRAVCAAAASHTFTPHLPPCWLMIIGPSRSGKTTFLEIMRKLPHVWLVSDLTPKTLFSAWERKGKTDSGLMNRIGESGLILIKDFTTLLSHRQESKGEIFSQLREIYDGGFDKHAGTGATVRWRGRATIIAACTPAIDRERMIFRTMGDRFLEVRLRPSDPFKVARFVASHPQMPDLSQLQDQLLALSKHKVDFALTDALLDELARLACWLAVVRTPVEWDFNGTRILDVASSESPTTITQSLLALTIADAALCQADPSIELARRIADDSCPPKRLSVLKALTNEYADSNDVQDASKLNTYSFKRAVQELVALSLVHCESSGIGEDSQDSLRLS